MNLKVYERFLNEKIAAKNLLLDDTERLSTEIQERQSLLADYTECVEVMNVVSVLSQQEFEQVVQVLVTQALQFVFGSDHSFEIDGGIARNQSEINLFLVIDGERFSPRDDEFSGGQADVVSFALRVILWAIAYSPTRPTLIFDEPFRNLHGVSNGENIREMIRYLSDTLHLQFIIITKDADLTMMADASFRIIKNHGISTATLLQELIGGVDDVD